MLPLLLLTTRKLEQSDNASRLLLLRLHRLLSQCWKLL
jgi:hypothetical protein